MFVPCPLLSCGDVQAGNRVAHFLCSSSGSFSWVTPKRARDKLL